MYSFVSNVFHLTLWDSSVLLYAVKVDSFSVNMVLCTTVWIHHGFVALSVDGGLAGFPSKKSGTIPLATLNILVQAFCQAHVCIYLEHQPETVVGHRIAAPFSKLLYQFTPRAVYEHPSCSMSWLILNIVLSFSILALHWVWNSITPEL